MIRALSEGGMRRIALVIWCVCFLALVALWACPVVYRLNRAAMILLFILLWAGALWLWKARWVKAVCLGLLTIATLITLLPGSNPDPARLRADYVDGLKRYEGTPYVWGGENRLGIDCSGLVRRGLIDASLREGIACFNPGLIRQSFAMRWYDCSAKALMEEYRAQTHHLFRVESIQTLDHSRILPGDFGVTANGVHTLAYLGDSLWIEADPGPHKVVVVNAKEDVGWLRLPVQIMRWRIFEKAL
jgi:NlpC/P60 family